MNSHASVRYEDRDRGRIGFVTIERPDKLNSLSTAVMRDLEAVLHRVAVEPNLRAVVLTGAGDKAFICGADIDEMSQLGDPKTARAFITSVHRCSQALRDIPAPVIARINGYCLGAGLEVAAACDLRLCATTAVLGMPETKLGVPSVIEAALLPSLIGWGRARRILYTGETFGAEQALAWGLVEEIHPPALLDAAVDALLDKLLDAEPRAVQLQKALMQRWEELPMSEAIAAGIVAFEDAWTTDAPAKAMAAHLADRKGRKITVVNGDS